MAHFKWKINHDKRFLMWVTLWFLSKISQNHRFLIGVTLSSLSKISQNHRFLIRVSLWFLSRITQNYRFLIGITLSFLSKINIFQFCTQNNRSTWIFTKNCIIIIKKRNDKLYWPKNCNLLLLFCPVFTIIYNKILQNVVQKTFFRILRAV